MMEFSKIHHPLILVNFIFKNEFTIGKKGTYEYVPFSRYVTYSNPRGYFNFNSCYEEPNWLSLRIWMSLLEEGDVKFCSNSPTCKKDISGA